MAVLSGIAGQGWEDVALQTSASFWRPIEKWRQQALPLAEAC